MIPRGPRIPGGEGEEHNVNANLPISGSAVVRQGDDAITCTNDPKRDFDDGGGEGEEHNVNANIANSEAEVIQEADQSSGVSFRVMTWNLRRLTLNQNVIPWEERKKHIIKTLCEKDTLPDILVIQEVLSGKARETLNDLVITLNKSVEMQPRRKPGPTPRYYDGLTAKDRHGFDFSTVSKTEAKQASDIGPPPEYYRVMEGQIPVVSQIGAGGMRESIAVIYRAEIFDRVEVAPVDFGEEIQHLESASVLTAAYSRTIGWRPFDRNPVVITCHLAYKESNTTTAPFCIIASHASTGQEQNMFEVAFMQELCESIWNRHSIATILLGDFNVDEAGNRDMWDTSIDMDQDEAKLSVYSSVRNDFLGNFEGCLESCVTTNLFPFLGAFEEAHPKHNDNIWVLKQGFQFAIRAATERFVCARTPPSSVLQFWDNELQKCIRMKSIPSEMRLVDGKMSWKKKVTDLISHSWSDHRPVVADIELSNVLLIKQSKGMEKKPKNKEQLIKVKKERQDAIDLLRSYSS